MNKNIKFIIGIIITITTLNLLLKNIQYTEILNIAKQISTKTIILTFSTYTLMNLIRAIRIKRIFKKISFKKIVNIVLIHNMINNILPFRIGELSYLYMIKKEESTKKAIKSLLKLRLLDLTAITIIFITSMIFTNTNKNIKQLFIIITGTIILTTIIFIRDKKNLDLIKLTMDSIILWALSFLFYYIFTKTFNIQLSFFQVSIAATLIILTTIIPINGVAGLGTTELAWTIGLLTFGIDKKIAITTGIIIHLFRITYFSILGLIGLILKSHSEQTTKNESSKELTTYKEYYKDKKRMKISEVIKKHFKNKKINYCDVACGYGRMTSHFEKTSYKSTGIDVSNEMLTIAEKTCTKTTFIKTDITKKNLNKKYDLITCFRYFVNAKKPEKEKMIKAIRKIVKNNGLFIFNIHKNPNLTTKIYSKYQRIINNKKVNTTSRKEVEKLIKELFEIKQTIANDYIGLFKLKFIKNKTLIKIIISTDKLIDAITPNKFATNIVYVCKPK